jgi:hypothetical protein
MGKMCKMRVYLNTIGRPSFFALTHAWFFLPFDSRHAPDGHDLKSEPASAMQYKVLDAQGIPVGMMAPFAMCDTAGSRGQ